MENTMKADPIQLAVCLTTRDHVTGTTHLTVGWREKKRHVIEESYEVRAGPGLVLLVKEDGTFHEVRLTGCSCPDANYRRRSYGCKHQAAVRLAGLLGAQRTEVRAG